MIQISVIIPTYQRRDFVVANIKMLEYQTFEEGFEVICIIDGAQDGTLEALQALDVSFPFQIIYQENQGAAAARNKGAKAAKGQILLFLDDDMEADKDLILEHYQSHLAGANAVIGHIPYHPNVEETPLFKWYREWIEERYQDLIKRKELRFTDFYSGQVSVKKDLFFSVGGFDINYNLDKVYGLEDTDLGHKLVEIRKSIFIFNPKAISYQKFDIDPAIKFKRESMVGRNYVYLKRKFPKIKSLNPSEVPIKKSRLRLRKLILDFSFYFPWVIKFFSWVVNKLSFSLFKLKAKESIQGFFFSCASTLNYYKGIINAGGLPNSNYLRVLSYHSISNNDDDQITGTYTVSQSKLKKQIKSLKKLKFQFITPEEFLRFIKGQALLPKNAVLLTFDGGYEDFFENALPILKEEKVSTFLFVVSGLIGGLNDWDIKLGAHPIKLLDIEKLKYLIKNKIAIGAHSRFHSNLASLRSDDLESEINEMLDDFKKLKLPISKTFAYPFGKYDTNVMNTITKAGFEVGFTIDRGFFRKCNNSLTIPRMVVRKHHNLFSFILFFFTYAYFKRT